MPIPISALEVAQYLLYLDQETSKSGEVKGKNWEPITNLKLQKLLYYCQAQNLLSTGIPKFVDKIVAWMYGPVVKEVYENYAEHRAEIIHSEVSNSNKLNLDSSHIETIKFVYELFKKDDANTLVQKTHNEAPWIHAYYTLGLNSEITPKLIYQHFFKV